jgi:hypothetical protein
MDTAVIAALIGALVTLIVAIITVVITIRGWQEEYRRLIEQRQWEARIRHLQSQIEELYGPLWALNQQSKILYEIATELLPSENGKVRSDKFTSDNDFKLWQFLIETYFIPLNARKAELINTKSYLCELSESGELPESFEQFLEHQAQSECLYRLRKFGEKYDISRPSSYLQGKAKKFKLAWSSEFDDLVKTSLNGLREKYASTLSSYKQSKKYNQSHQPRN